MHTTPSGSDGSADATPMPPPSLEELADLQAGLLDDATATRLRGRVRSEPAAAERLRALDRVRAELAALNPAEHHVTGPAGRRAAHARYPHTRRLRLLGAAAGIGAVVVAILVGTAALRSSDSPAPAPAAVATANHITVSVPPPTIPLTAAQIVELMHRPADYGGTGVLGDPTRRASCLSGLGYPASTRVLGAEPMNIASWPAVVLVLPGDDATHLRAVAVAPNCSAADTGVIADTTVARP